MPATPVMPASLRMDPITPAARLRRVLYAVRLDAAQKFGSLEEMIARLARAFHEEDSVFLPVFLATPGDRGLRPYREGNLPVAGLGLHRFRPATLARLVGLVYRHRIEVVHWNFYSPLTNGYLWALTALAPRVRHYFTDHNSRDLPPAGPGPRWKRLVKSLFLKRYARVLGVSGFVADCLRRQEVWPEPAACPLFVNTERFAPDDSARADVRRRLGARNRVVLLTVGQLIRAKGIDVVLRALAVLPEHVVLWVVGGGEEARALEELAGELGIAGRVRFLGLQSEVEPYLQAADVFVCPSRWAEAAGLVNLEAQACGLPVVASDVGGIPEYVADGRTGLLFPAGDHRRLTERLGRLIADVGAARAMGLAARQWVVDRFSTDARLEEYLDLYRCPR
jgi:glycosyltransferase involved in cell wall biosynthesis